MISQLLRITPSQEWNVQPAAKRDSSLHDTIVDSEPAASRIPVLTLIANLGKCIHRPPLQSGMDKIRSFAHHPDPLVEASNWVALIIGTHLPFWPLYVWCSAGLEALPTALLTMALAPVFLLVPWVARRNGLLGRMMMLITGIANTAFTIWILGNNTGTDLFLAPCAALAAILFRQTERWVMIIFTTLPLAVWYMMQYHAPIALHHYNALVAHEIFNLNAISVSVLITSFGWLQADIYRRLEKMNALQTTQPNLSLKLCQSSL